MSENPASSEQSLESQAPTPRRCPFVHTVIGKDKLSVMFCLGESCMLFDDHSEECSIKTLAVSLALLQEKFAPLPGTEDEDDGDNEESDGDDDDDSDDGEGFDNPEGEDPVAEVLDGIHRNRE